MVVDGSIEGRSVVAGLFNVYEEMIAFIIGINGVHLHTGLVYI